MGPVRETREIDLRKTGADKVRIGTVATLREEPVHRREVGAAGFDLADRPLPEADRAAVSPGASLDFLKETL